MLLVSNETGIIANLDSNSFGYLALGAALFVFLGGGLLSRYRGQAGPGARHRGGALAGPSSGSGIGASTHDPGAPASAVASQPIARTQRTSAPPATSADAETETSRAVNRVLRSWC